MPNIALLDQIIAHVKAHPEEWDQGNWVQKTSCGTSYCIAGFATMFTMPEGHSFSFGKMYGNDTQNAYYVGTPDNSVAYTIRQYAEDALRLDYDQARILFDGGNTLEEIEVIRNALANDTLFAEEILYDEGSMCSMHPFLTKDCVLWEQE
jgi:hypothetical protein